MSRASDARGFTLLEVLVALAIIAVALTAALRGAMALTSNARDVDRRLYAGMLAQNLLLEARLAQGQTAPIDAQFACEQGGMRFTCRQKVSTTPNPFYRWLQVDVSDEADPAYSLASLMALVRVD